MNCFAHRPFCDFNKNMTSFRAVYIQWNEIENKVESHDKSKIGGGRKSQNEGWSFMKDLLINVDVAAIVYIVVRGISGYRLLSYLEIKSNIARFLDGVDAHVESMIKELVKEN